MDSAQSIKKIAIQAVGVISLVIGVVLIPVPLIPGWPFLLFGAYCFRIASEM